jgi:hypothetical protein
MWYKITGFLQWQNSFSICTQNMFFRDNFDRTDSFLFESCGLSWPERLVGFGIFFGVGWFLNFMSFFVLLNNVRNFCILYTCGNILAIMGSFVLWGPCAQVRDMFKKKRYIASLLYIFFMIMTIVAAVKGWPLLLVITLAICQFLASIWYFISYIPFARSGVKFCCRQVVIAV